MFKGLVQLSAAFLIIIIAAPASAQTSLPRFPGKTYYGDAREKLRELGYTPVVPRRAQGQCQRENTGREEICERWPEVQSCAGTGFARCSFAWRRGRMVIEVRTVGDEREIVDRVRCRSGCG